MRSCANRLPIVLVASLALAAIPVAKAQEAATSSFTSGHVHVTATRTPEKRLDFEVTVPASVDQVWNAFTVADELATWCAPTARVRLALGGEWEVGFAGSAPGGGTILSWLPEEMLAIHAMAPESFPTVRKERTIAVFRFDAAGDKQTRVRLAQFGWKEGSEWDRAFDYLSKGNAMLLEMLYTRFSTGPLDWKAMAARRKEAKPDPGAQTH